MRMIKKISALLLLVVLSLTVVGCYAIQAQTMRNLKGTYKLTTYTYTASYERKEGYTPKTKNYVEDPEYLYEEYLVITGAGAGYFAHKDATGNVYVKEVRLDYEYLEEDTNKIEYVSYNDLGSLSSGTDEKHLGVSNNMLNFSRPSFDYTQLFTDKLMRSEDISVRWDKVDKATDLSYVYSQIPELND